MAKYKPDFELFDVSDVEHEIRLSKKCRNEVDVHFKSETDFNLVKLYLALKALCEKIEVELNLLEQAKGEH